MPKIDANWEAILKTEELIREQTGDPEAGFNASSFFFGKEGRQLMIPCMYRKKIKRYGEVDFTKSYDTIMVTAKFCPFTGKPLFTDSEDINK